jgi:CCGSCS motif protein
MSFSIKKLLQKDKSATEQVAQAQPSTAKPLATEVTSGKAPAKHGENGACCGGCK